MIVTFRFESGSFQEGFQVSSQIDDDEGQKIGDIPGRFPPASQISGHYGEWQIDYNKVGKYKTFRLVILPIPAKDEINFSELLQKCQNSSKQFLRNFNSWLSDAEDSQVQKFLRNLTRVLGQNEANKILIHIRNDTISAEDVTLLKKMPWHQLKIVDNAYIGNESAFVSSTVTKPLVKLRTIDTVRILAILGNSEGIDVEGDRKILENLPNTEIKFLTEPKRKEMGAAIRGNNWDIFFFSGHSSSEGGIGRIIINKNDNDNSLTIDNLKNSLRVAVNNGLRLAIFNSCDGLKLADDFADLNIPQVIVMREPVPNEVAQEFLTHFLGEFSKGVDLYLAVRHARNMLEDEGLDKDFPGASWLPLIFQNPMAPPFFWPPLPVPRVPPTVVNLLIGHQKFGDLRDSSQVRLCEYLENR